LAFFFSKIGPQKKWQKSPKSDPKNGLKTPKFEPLPKVLKRPPIAQFLGFEVF